MMQARMCVIACLALGVPACATAPKTSSERASLEQQADVTLASMRERDPGLDGMLARSAGYVVFPQIGKGGLIAGGAHGRGVLYEQGRKVGFVELSQASIGAQIGGETFSELVVLQRPSDVIRLKAGTYELGASASAVALTSGAAASTTFREGVAVFVVPRGGLMADLSITGQRLNFAPRG